MLMNRIETWTVNNPVRALLQRSVEARALEQIGGRLRGGRALELGCGHGEGVRIVLDRFCADEYVGLDLDPAQVDRARRRVQEHHRHRVDLRVGDAAALDFPDASFTAVFDFAILHHVPEWRQALCEVHRVLAPGGRFYFEEVLRGFLATRASRALFRHPEEGHFTLAEFTDACREAGLVPVRPPLDILGWFTLGVAVRADERSTHA
jgi:ubiquinone/menaquinone biosynthesis C-methylase UbiE